MDPGISKDKALELIKQKCDFALQRHLVHVSQAMEAVADHLGHGAEKDFWSVAGLLHDIDWNETINAPEKHCGPETMDFIRSQGGSNELIETIRSHYTLLNVPMDSDHRKALFACDELSGFIVAAALVRPTKMMGINAQSVIKKMKSKGFAAQVSREDMTSCENFFNIPLAEFIGILIPPFEAIAPEWGLA